MINKSKRNVSLLHLRFRFAKACYMNFFDLIAPLYAKVHLSDEKTFKTISELGNLEKTDKVLDLGGGTGRVAKFFADKVQEIVVVDDSKGMILHCQKHPGLKCLLGSAESIPFNDNYFDKVIIIDAFHHFPNQEKAIKEIRRVLKKNGQAIIEEVNFGKLGNWLLEKAEMIVGAKSKIFSLQSLTELFSKNQFKTKLFSENRSGYYLLAEK